MSTKKIAARVALKRMKKSTTVWLNTIAALLTTVLAGVELQFHLLKDALGDKWPVAFVALAATNAALRFRTEYKHVKPQIQGEPK